jgi:hypothetical protein
LWTEVRDQLGKLSRISATAISEIFVAGAAHDLMQGRNVMKRCSFLTMPGFFVYGLIVVVSVLGPRAEAQMSGSELLGRGSTANPGVLPPQSHAFGNSYSEWSVAFWQWLYSLPVDSHPLFDTADCSEGQSGKVWFLGGTFTFVSPNPDAVVGVADRDCSVPSGKALFFPIVNAECNPFEDPEATEEALRVCANFLGDHIQDLEVTIDGRHLGKLGRYRVESPLFTFGPVPENNVLGADAGTTFDSVGDGYYIMLAPLSRGEHRIHFEGAAVFTQDPDGFDFLFGLDITYDITVE